MGVKFVPVERDSLSPFRRVYKITHRRSSRCGSLRSSWHARAMGRLVELGTLSLDETKTKANSIMQL